MMIDGKEYSTVEHWFQSQKFTNPDLQEKIRICGSPMKAKQLGKTRDPSFQTNWNELRDEIMLKGLREKFQQNPILGDKLRATETEELIEQSPWDSYWGNGRNGLGKNRMGQLLMKVRSEIS